MNAAACMRIALIALAMAGLPALASAAELSSYEAEYTLFNEKAVVDIRIGLESNTTELELALPPDASAVEAEGAIFEVQEGRESKTLRAHGLVFDKLHVTYSTASVLEKTSDDFFLLDLSGVSSPRKTVTVKLPEKAFLKYSLNSPQPSIIPKTSDVRTDGRRIIITWTEGNFMNSDAVMVIYNSPRAGRLWLIPVGAAAGGLAVLTYYLKRRRLPAFVQKAGKQAVQAAKPELAVAAELTRNLLEEEKKIVELLIGSEEGLWQKQIEIKSGISKVRLSRKLRSLEQKGLIEKIPYGNANKIRLKKA